VEKKRLDILLLEKEYFKTREKARKAIMAGIVFVDDTKEDKPGMKFRSDSNIVVKKPDNPYVSRGGLKLEKALSLFRS
jgi:23S rRNA (cytidine1920-2'-O)/16S rRNA (cytidine1409-2'-O)-methyltransferase